MNNQKTAEQLAKEQDKDLQTKLQSYVEVARHQLGRTPTLEEVMSLMHSDESEGHGDSEPELEDQDPELEQAEGENSDPRILGMKVYHGMKKTEESNEPDDRKILFYEDPEGCVYDCGKQEWLDGRPQVLDHLNSRSMYGDDQDLIAAIANGVMGDEDYESLDKAGMVGETPQKLWMLTKKLEGQVSELEKAGMADELEKSEENEEVMETEAEESDGYEPQYESGPDMGSEELYSGSDNVKDLVASAVAQATLGPHFENRVREIVKEMTGGGSSEEVQDYSSSEYQEFE